MDNDIPHSQTLREEASFDLHTYLLPFLLSGAVFLFILGLIVYFLYTSLFPQKVTVTLAPTQSSQASTSPTAFPTVDPTLSWKTYTNSKYGYTLKYPQEFYIPTQDSNATTVSIVPIGYYQLSDPQRINTLSIEITVFPSSTTPLNWITNEARPPGFSNIREITPMTINNHQAAQFISNNTQAGSGADSLYTIIEINNNLIMITLSNFNKQETKEPYNNLLSTFRFDDLTPTTSP